MFNEVTCAQYVNNFEKRISSDLCQIPCFRLEKHTWLGLGARLGTLSKNVVLLSSCQHFHNCWLKEVNM